MGKIWLLIKITLLFVGATTIICGLILLVQQHPPYSRAVFPTIYLFITPLILGNVLLLSWCQVYNYKHLDRTAE